jgi:hypothetical protein
MGVKEEIHSQIFGRLTHATFPIEAPEDLLEALPVSADNTDSFVFNIYSKCNRPRRILIH